PFGGSSERASGSRAHRQPRPCLFHIGSATRTSVSLSAVHGTCSPKWERSFRPSARLRKPLRRIVRASFGQPGTPPTSAVSSQHRICHADKCVLVGGPWNVLAQVGTIVPTIGPSAQTPSADRPSELRAAGHTANLGRVFSTSDLPRGQVCPCRRSMERARPSGNDRSDHRPVCANPFGGSS